MDKTERLSLFNRELSYIKDRTIRSFAETLLEDADEYFFTVPASSSGKYHPPFARGDGGLVRHTKAVAFFTLEFARSEREFATITAREVDLLIVAAIAHDIKKQGDGTSGHTLLKEHPLYGAEYVKNEYEQHNFESKGITKEEMNFIYNAVRSHMGPWCDIKPQTRTELIVFYADYVASRSEIEGLNFITNNINSAIPISEQVVDAPKMTVDEYVFNFSKMKGLTIKEAYEKEPGFVKWMANKEGFGNADVQNLVKEFLKTI